MAKILKGKVVSNKMQNTVVVEVFRLTPHPLYRKLLKRSKKYKVETNGQKTEVGQIVEIVETRPVSKEKHFALIMKEKLKAEKEKPKAEKEKPVKIKKEKKV